MRLAADTHGSRRVSRSVVLASASPRRRELLRALVAEYTVVAADVPEPLTGDARRDAVALARAKAEAVAARHPTAVVVAADTIVHESARLYGKPTDAEDAVRMLTELRGREHEVVTGVAVAADGMVRTALSTATVRMAAVEDAIVHAYVATGVPLDKAGAYAVQDDDFGIVEGWRGCYCCIVGLPLWRLRTLLRWAGVEAAEPSATFTRCATCPERA